MECCKGPEKNINKVLRCSVCEGKYHYECLNLSAKQFSSLTVEMKENWKCPTCTNVTRRQPNTNTPLADKLPAQLSELSLRPRPVPAYTIRKISPNEQVRVLEFLRRFFFRDEPLNIAVNLLETADARCEELEEYVISSLTEGVSVAAVDSNDEFVGIVVNGIGRRAEFCTEDKSEDCPNPKFKRILKLLGYLEREAKIWDKLPESCTASLEIRIVSTHSDWRGRGLMKAMVEESERIASETGLGVVRMDATSAFSAAAAERLKYKKVYSVSYAELSFAPKPEPPHFAASVYLKHV